MKHNEALDDLSKEGTDSPDRPLFQKLAGARRRVVPVHRAKAGHERGHAARCARMGSGFTVIEARRIKIFRPARYAGLGGLKKALSLRFYANINEDEAILRGIRFCTAPFPAGCRMRVRAKYGIPSVQTRRGDRIRRVCATIDPPRVTCTCVSCYPQITDDTCACSWLFTLHE